VAQASSEPTAESHAAVNVRLPDDVDLHARPAADFVRAAMGFAASIRVAAGGREKVDAKSLLSVLALGAKGGTELGLSATGEDAAAALEALSARVATLSD
jgi:phosphocarrier protein HPr